MENDIKPARIANSIMQDTRYQGHYVLVEGAQDIKIFKSFFLHGIATLKVMHGKHNMRDVYEMLLQRGFDKMIGIRDADFLRIPNNEKFSPNYEWYIFPTDFHDAEGMVLNSPALMDFIFSVSSEEKVKSFESKRGSIIDLAYNLVYPLACLRLANKKNDLGLSFKPKEKDGNRLKFKKFICEKSISYLGDDIMINTVWEYSQNRGRDIPTREVMKESMNEIISLHIDLKEMANGHDLAEALFIICKKGLGSQSKLLVDAGCIEDLLFLAYESSYFKGSGLFEKISGWENENGLRLTI
ncbi:DUF4435 domain-containing protein [Serratia marcescens]|uniref:DUF4435 domain-containing protein n=1 Tax=Serratia marcescens TaxID=615 RepID=UPI000E2C138F|nr:DUF4435 domain-containing protein [Serratia marcescens]